MIILSPGHDLLIILALGIIFRMWGRGIALMLKAYDYERPNTERGIAPFPSTPSKVKNIGDFLLTPFCSTLRRKLRQ